MHDLKHFLDGLSVAALVTTIAGFLPHLTAALVMVWTVYRIYEVRLSIRLKKLEISRLENKDESNDTVVS